MIVERQKARAMRGFTLTEAAIVLGIVGLILGGVWVAAASVYTNLRISRASEQLLSVVQGVRALYATSSDFGAAVPWSVALGQTNAVPADMLGKNGANVVSIINPWAGIGGATPAFGTRIVQGQAASAAADAAPPGADAAGTGSASNFSVVFYGVPQNACPDLVQKVSGLSGNVGLTRVHINAGALTITPPAIPSIPAIVAACNGTSTNSISFTYNMR